MKVILLEDVKKQGKKGQVIEVSDGYGRNYLIKNGLAKEADSGALNHLKSKKKQEQKQAAEDLAEAKLIQKQLDQDEIVVEIPAKVGDEGKLFGTITSKQIGDSLKQQHDIKVDRRNIQLDQNIAALGHYQVPIKLHPEVEGTIKVHVVAE
ncbi:50S ribosomal protein L9 [Hutsoniella sourekii]|uniref:50S ribosomal protein L9 n=1 Tax=Hutsoniella sourekii TaxID=87650 RepID=UPI00047F61F3|nr:50S ribosomal protein L9 [Hutsoniella sourekii]